MLYTKKFKSGFASVIFSRYNENDERLHVKRKEIHMQITDIKIRKFFDEGPMKAVVSVTFDDALAVHDIKVIYARDRYFIVMPSRKNPDGTYRDIVHPINAAFRADLETAVIDAYNVQLIAYRESEEEYATSARTEETVY